MITIARSQAAHTALTLAAFAFEFDASGVSALNRAGTPTVQESRFDGLSPVMPSALDELVSAPRTT